MANTLKLVESPSGTGHLVPKGGGEAIEVRYRLSVYRNMLHAGNSEYIPGLLQIQGEVCKPGNAIFTIQNVGKYFTLSLEDGRRLDFFFRDQNGSITSTGSGLYSNPA